MSKSQAARNRNVVHIAQCDIFDTIMQSKNIIVPLLRKLIGAKTKIKITFFRSPRCAREQDLKIGPVAAELS